MERLGGIARGKSYEILYMHRYDIAFNEGITIGEGLIAYHRFVQIREPTSIPDMVPIARVFVVVHIDQVQLSLHSTQVKTM